MAQADRRRGRSANGQGSVRARETKSGVVWDVQISVREQGTGRPSRLTKRGFKTQKEAVAWASKARKTGAVARGGNVRVKDAAESFWQNFDGAVNTRRAYEKAINDLAAAMGGRRMRAITPAIVESVVNSDKWSMNTAKTRRTAIQRFLRWAESEGLTTRQLRLDVAETPTRGARPARRAPATRDQVQAVVGVDSEWSDLWAVFAGTGIRSGEARALTSDHLIGARRILVAQSAGPRKGDAIGPPKTGQPRIVGAPESVVQRLQARGPGFLFQTGGTPIAQKFAEARLREDCAAAGVEPFTMHQFRHYWATEAFRRGINPKVVQEQLGHQSVGITLDTYTSLTGVELEDAAEMLGL